MDAALSLYEKSQQDKGSRPESMRHWRAALLQFFRGRLDRQLASLTPANCAAMYEHLRTQPSPRTGKPLAVDSHRGYLSIAKAFLGFCVEMGYLRANPLAAVKGVGRRRKGKTQLRIDEARTLYSVALDRAAQNDEGAAAVLVGLLMGFRPGEIVSRTVRDLDDGGTLLWVDDQDAIGFEKKTESSRRAVRVPEPLQPILRGLARDKVGAALLWSLDGGAPHGACWVNRMVARLCAFAGVPRVCAHSLRGLQATTALHAGATPDLVAAVLGHESSAMTLKHYAAKGSKQASEQVARVIMLRGDPR